MKVEGGGGGGQRGWGHFDPPRLNYSRKAQPLSHKLETR